MFFYLRYNIYNLLNIRQIQSPCRYTFDRWGSVLHHSSSYILSTIVRNFSIPEKFPYFIFTLSDNNIPSEYKISNNKKSKQ